MAKPTKAEIEARKEAARLLGAAGGKIGGVRRWEGVSKAEAHAVRSKGGRAGSKARMLTLTPERRSEIAKKAAKARWAKR